jgi:hypothetical protein
MLALRIMRGKCEHRNVHRIVVNSTLKETTGRIHSEVINFTCWAISSS